ncbi:hypothetical protein J1N10_15930 [Carboxylicivirga sp. A043]|uniref:hypothetical protein n=1 Tax=Carboxylicivirga litoralis TaxID=2816963 RepID=UPI0021CB6C74|nr:hypothetical protein [Carboxylicivirga sp. A043]MCU4157467.1 hypothetical protein [Carboxylicivirga sp. A043]
MKIGILKSTIAVLVFVLAFLSCNVNAQTKKEVQFSLDTLYRSHLKLNDEYRQLIERWKQYDAFYRHVKATMLEKELANEPIEEGAVLVDEAWNKQTAHLKSLEDSTVYLVDSLNRLYEQHQLLQLQNELYLRMLTGQLNEAAFPHTEKELLGSWNLFLKPMQLSGDAYHSGLISHNPFTVADSLQQYNIYRLEFLPDELANIYFKDGRSQKCFYEVNAFSAGQPYSISYSKQEEFKMTIHVSPMPSGLEVSYEIPLDTTQVLYFNGVMKP